ncbi:F-box protein [Criblamydia sequanensis]|uniref:F-box domain-containing protein n=1 Tax=Candidatus Criblamydia sequanensis CRIB-18 TaxID=1437425 RepID=A0A090D0H8_9BACT|nr:F-box protein [Criblamydia sequanensis]CDR34791.1 F-box domain-containing protein [Criblamydia sequanensis CRIB-18]
MQASAFDSPQEAYFALTALPLDQQLSRNMGSLNALPKEIITMIFNEGSFSELNQTRLVSKTSRQIVDPEFKKVRSLALQNFEMMRPHIFKLFGMKSAMDPYHRTNFILDKEGNLVALSGADEIMFVKDEEGNFKQSKDFVPTNDHSTLTIDWSKGFYRFDQSVKIVKMPENGFAKKVAEAMASLAFPIYEGAYALALANKRPDQNFVDFRNVIVEVATEEFKTSNVLRVGTERLHSINK